MNLKKMFYDVNTPEELMEFMNQYIKYGWIGKDNKIRIACMDDFVEQYRMSTLEEVFEIGVGICFEQVALEQEFFNRQKIETKAYCIFTTHMCHAFLMYKNENMFYKFEHSSFKSRGIYSYKSENKLLNAEIQSFCIRHHIKNVEKLKVVQYDKIKEHSTIKDVEENFKQRENIIMKILNM